MSHEKNEDRAERLTRLRAKWASGMQKRWMDHPQIVHVLVDDLGFLLNLVDERDAVEEIHELRESVTYLDDKVDELVGALYQGSDVKPATDEEQRQGKELLFALARITQLVALDASAKGRICCGAVMDGWASDGVRLCGKCGRRHGAA